MDIIYRKREDAPVPLVDGLRIVVDAERGFLQDYVSKDGKFEPNGRPYPEKVMQA
jgi:hypothetical protein